MPDGLSNLFSCFDGTEVLCNLSLVLFRSFDLKLFINLAVALDKASWGSSFLGRLATKLQLN